jgi:hypothetical protein
MKEQKTINQWETKKQKYFRLTLTKGWFNKKVKVFITKK